MIQKMLREIRGREERGWWGLLKGRGYKWRKFLMHWWGEGGECGRGGEGWAICLYSSHKEIKSQCL